MYIGIKFKKALFLDTKIIRSDILFTEENEYTVFCLK